MAVAREAATTAESWFRPDVEGLRGIAILMVVLGHAGLPGFSGGFVGVDVFFVISGYVITGLLLRELRHTSGIDFWAFYVRRVRRLLPAFAVMMVCTLVAVSTFLPGLDQRLQLHSGVWAAVWSSNIYFSLADFGYFAASARDSVFLHTWSLGVEEQFYLLWPPVLALTWKFSRRRSERSVARAIALVAAAGFMLSLIAVARWPIGAYYLMPFRLWELAVGGACSVAPFVASGTAARKLGIGGALLLVVACLGISESRPYPGLAALLPVGGTALLILSGSAREGSVFRLFSAPATKFLGKISYSWYLWHWPVLVLVRRSGDTGAMATATAVAISFLAAVTSYWLVERPIRNRAVADGRKAVSAGLLVSGMLALMPSIWQMATRDGNAVTGVAAMEERIRSTITVPQVYTMQGCDEWYSSDRLVPCVFQTDQEARPTAVILGDSIGLQWFPALSEIFRRSGWRTIVLTKSSCPIVDEPFYYERIKRRFIECETWRSAAIDFVKKIGPDMVLVGSAGSYPFTQEQWVDGSRRLLVRLKEGAGRIVVLAPGPSLPFDGPGCVIAKAASPWQGPAGTCEVPLAQAENPMVLGALSQAVASIDGATLVSMNDMVCPDGRCAAWSEGMLVFRDSQHLNAAFVDKLTEGMADRIRPSMGLHGAVTAQ